jgi:NADH-quinone oxidoreductase subunit N
MFFEEPVAGALQKEGAGALRFSVYALAAATALFGLFVGPLSALARASGLL